MTTTAPNRKHALTRMLLLGLAASLSLGAQAGEAKHPNSTIRSVTVSYADLDLGDAAGARTLYTRLKSAARQACGPAPSARDLAGLSAYEACYDRALTRAVQRIDSERLQALHAGRAGNTAVG